MKQLKQMVVGGFLILLCVCKVQADPGEEDYSSFFENQSDKGKEAYVLVQTRIWPETQCIIASGKQVLSPGEKTELVIAKKKGCEQAGVGYSMYKKADINHKNLIGYVSHRFRDGQFSLQVSLFCKGKECIFKGLNPEQ